MNGRMTLQDEVANPRRARFGPFELDCSNAGELRHDGIPVKLQEQPMRLLCVLLENAGSVVTREELRRRLWPADTFVDFDHSLNTAIRKLRAVLGDSADEPRWVETVARHGYRFIATVEWSSVPLEAAAVKTARRRRTIFSIAAGLVIIAIVIVAARSYFGKSDTVSAIAVLPLVNADVATAHLSDGVTEMVINSLASIRDLRVRARTTVFAWKGRPVEPVRAGRELRVPAILAGTFDAYGDQVHIHMELVDTADGAQLWGRSYTGTRAGIAALQQQIVDDVVTRLRPSLPVADRPRLKRPVNAAAFDLYLKGLHAWNGRTRADMKVAIDHFNQALEVDPQFAPAYAGLASTYGAMVGNGMLDPAIGQPKARAASDQALLLDPNLAEALTARAAAKAEHDLDFAGAEEDFKRALALNPSYPTAHAWYASFLQKMGRREEAWRHMRIAYDLDPLSPAMNWSMCGALYFDRKYEEAIAFAEKVRALDPRFYQPVWVRRSLIQLKRYEEAIELSIPGAAGEANATELRAALKEGGAQAYLDKRAELARRRYDAGDSVSAKGVANAYAVAGNADEAFHWLDQAIRRRESDVCGYYTDPGWDRLRSDARFTEFARRLGLPQVK